MIIRKMKTIFYLCAFVLVLMMAGCTNRYESVFDETADERVKKALAQYREQLVSATDGWKATLYPGAGGGYTFYFDFQEDGTVTMISDFDLTTAGTSMEGTFVMKGLQRPTLSFDTYSYIHLLADPSNTINGGEDGVGLVSDFEFAFTKAGNDTLTLKGIQRNSDIILIKASAQERADYLSGALEESLTDAIDYFSATPYSYVDINGTTFFFYPNQNSRVFSTFLIDQNDAVLQSSETFSFTPEGFSLKKPVTVGNTTFQEIFWDDVQGKYYILSGTQKLYFQASNVPPIPLIDELGYLHTFIVMDPASINNIPQSFLDIYDQAKVNVAAVPLYGLVLDAFSLEFNDTNTSYINYYIHNSQGNYRAQFTCNRTIVGNTMKFTVVDMDFNAEIIEDALTPMTEYFEDHDFLFDYEVVGEDLLAKVTPVDLPGTYFLGFLE